MLTPSLLAWTTERLLTPTVTGIGLLSFLDSRWKDEGRKDEG